METKTNKKEYNFVDIKILFHAMCYCYTFKYRIYI